MRKKINRRSFIKKSAAIGAVSVLGQTLIPNITRSQEPIDIAVVQGQNYFENAKKAVEILGGMSRFVPAGSSVAILPNPQSYNPGTYTKPEIVRAAIQMCKAAGATKIACLGWLPLRYWQNTGIKRVIDSEGIDLVIQIKMTNRCFKKYPCLGVKHSKKRVS